MHLPPLEPVAGQVFIVHPCHHRWHLWTLHHMAPLWKTWPWQFGAFWLFEGSWNMTPTWALIGGIPSNLQYIGSCLEMIPCDFPNTFFGQWGQTIYIEGKLEKSTPLKTKMTRENQVFEDVSAVKTVDFPLPCWISVGRKPFLNRSFLWQKFTVHKISRKSPKKSCLVWWVHLGRLSKKYRFRPWILLKALT